MATVLVAYVRSGDRQIKDPEELATLFLVLMWSTWVFSSLFSFWGARRTAMRILVGYGAFWLVFVIASSVGPEWQGPLGLIMGSLVVVPFFALAYVARRWPRVAGVLLLAAVAFFVKFFGWYEFGTRGEVTQLVTMILFLGPLLGGGVALLGTRDEAGNADAA